MNLPSGFPFGSFLPCLRIRDVDPQAVFDQRRQAVDPEFLDDVGPGLSMVFGLMNSNNGDFTGRATSDQQSRKPLFTVGELFIALLSGRGLPDIIFRVRGGTVPFGTNVY